MLAHLVLLASLAIDQTPRVKDETIEVSLVNVDVVVTDKSGNHVTGLTKDDFVIVDDGKPQAITNFTEYRDAAGGGTQDASPDASQQASLPRAIVVWIDDFHVPNFRKDPLFAALKTTLHAMIRPSDGVMIVHWRVRPSIVVPYTNDLARVDAALDEISAASTGVKLDFVSQARAERDLIMNAIAGHDSGGLNDPAPGSPGAPQRTDFYGNRIGSIDPNRDAWVTYDNGGLDEMYMESHMALWELKEKVLAMKAVLSSMPPDSRKAMIVLPNALSLTAMSGSDALFGVSNRRVSPQDRERFGSKRLMQSLLDAATSHGVTLYPMIPEGISAPDSVEDAMRVDRYEDMLKATTVLSSLADLSGGLMASNPLEAQTLLPRVHEDLSSYYSLAYRTPSRFDDKTRKLTVRAKNPHYVVRARREFVERTPAMEIRDRVVAALFQADGQRQSEIAIELQLGKMKAVGGNSYLVPATVRIPASALMVTDGNKPKGAFTVYVASARATGVGGNVVQQTLSFRPSDVPPDGMFKYDCELLTDLQTTRVSVAVLDEVSRSMGFTRSEMPRRVGRK